MDPRSGGVDEGLPGQLGESGEIVEPYAEICRRNAGDGRGIASTSSREVRPHRGSLGGGTRTETLSIGPASRIAWACEPTRAMFTGVPTSPGPGICLGTCRSYWLIPPKCPIHVGRVDVVDSSRFDPDDDLRVVVVPVELRNHAIGEARQPPDRLRLHVDGVEIGVEVGTDEIRQELERLRRARIRGVEARSHSSGDDQVVPGVWGLLRLDIMMTVFMSGVKIACSL